MSDFDNRESGMNRKPSIVNVTIWMAYLHNYCFIYNRGLAFVRKFGMEV